MYIYTYTHIYFRQGNKRLINFQNIWIAPNLDSFGEIIAKDHKLLVKCHCFLIVDGTSQTKALAVWFLLR